MNTVSGIKSSPSVTPMQFAGGPAYGGPIGYHPSYDAYSPLNNKRDGLSLAEKSAVGLKNAIQPGKLIKNAIFWHAALGLPVALIPGGFFAYPLIPAIILLSAARRFLKGFMNPEKVAKSL